jgi:phosphoribosylformimino-5-aminoimidazole carboxamide ribotide isomerase
MNLYPAIDLKDGQCVRLLRGEMDKATVFANTPAAQAKSFEDAGFQWLHIVDLNGAFAGHPVNEEAVKSILAATSLPAQLGGGIREMSQIEAWLNAGIKRVILGTVALRNPEFVKQACKAFPQQIAVGIDAKNGMVAVEGWAETSDMKAVDLALKFEDAGVCVIIYTDIARDGAMQGANVAETVALANAISTPVILSGGVSSLADLEALKASGCTGIDGAIIGRALYDGAIQPAQALQLVA